MNSLRMAVIGVGALGRHHARILSQMEGVDLVAVADPGPNTQTVADACNTTGVADYQQLLTESALRPDAVSIAVPTVMHRRVATACLDAGIPVLVEKPLAGNVVDGTAIVELADQKQLPLQVGHVERFNPATQLAWSQCGKPNYIEAERLSPYSFRSTDIGVVHDLMIHDLDLILSLVQSPVVDVNAFGLCFMGDHEDTVKARLRFENGCIADLHSSRVKTAGKRTMQIWSSTGTTSVDFTTREVVHQAPTETLLFGQSPVERARQPDADIEQLKRDVFTKFLAVTEATAGSDDALTAELSSFVNSVQTGAECICSGREALQALVVAERVLECVAAHQWDGTPHGAVGPHAKFLPARKMAG